MAKIGSSVLADKHVRYRVRFITDPDARFEECNGEGRPLTRDAYAENTYIGCPDHPRVGLIPIEGTGIGHCRTCGKVGAPIPYAEYLAYYGNPHAHVYLMCLYAVGCDCCGHWEPEKHFLGGIDTMRDSPELAHRGKWLTVEYLEAHKDEMGYLYEVAQEALEEAGYKP